MKGFYSNVLASVFLISSISTLAQVNSVKSGDWNDVNTWDCGCVPDFNNGQIIIQNGHSVDLSSDVTISELVVSTGGVLTINAGVSLSSLGFSFVDAITVDGTLNNNGNIDVQDFDYLQINGRVNNSGTFTDVLASGTENWLFFNAGSIYDHKYTTSAGDIPMATWSSSSTVLITGYTSNTSAPGGLNQSFGNFTIAVTSLSASLSFGGNLNTVNGDLRVQSGNRPVYLNNGGTGYTLNIGGDLIVESGNFFLARSLSSPTVLEISGDLVQSGGTLIFANTSGSVSVNLHGDLTKTGGSWNSTIASDLVFKGESVQIVTNTASTGAILNYKVTSNSTVSLPGENFLSSTSATSSLMVDAGSSIELGSLNAIGAFASGTTAGNIRIAGTLSIASGATIFYNGVAPQYIGSGHPSSPGVNTVIDNDGGVTLSGNATFGGNVTLASGDLSVGNYTITFEGNFTPNSNSLAVTSSSSIVINGIGSFGTLTLGGSTTLNNFTLNRTTSGSISLGSDLTIAGTLTQTIGDITLNGHTLTVRGAYSRSNGSINVDANSSLIVSGSGALPGAVTFAGDQVLSALTVNRSGATFATNSSLTITNLNLLSGTFDNTGTITIATGGVITRTEGSFINNTPSAQTSYDIVYDIATDIVTGSEIPASVGALRHVTKTGGALLTLDQPLTINGDLTLSNGSLDAASFAVNLKGDFIANAVSTLTGSTITFSGDTQISGGSPVVFGDIVISGDVTPMINIAVNGDVQNNGTLNAGTGTTTFGGNTTISGSSVSAFNNIVINGSLTAPATSLNIAGNFVNNGTFNHSQGTVVFNGTTTLSGTATTNFFAVDISGSFTAPSGTLNIAGNLSNTGTFNHNNGTVLFNGTTAAQSVSGTYTFKNINISNPSKVMNNGNISLTGTLTLVSSGAIDADGSGSGVLIVKSTAVNAGGRIAALPDPTKFTGQVTIERYVNGPEGWRYFSMPLTNGNAGMWQAHFPVTGNFSNPSPVGVDNVTNSASPSIYYWNASTQAYVAVGSGSATGSTALSNTVGYSPYTYKSGSFTISTRGNIRTGNTSIPIASSGYALVPNPYPSAIDWDNVSKTGLSNTMSIRVSNGVFASYVAGGLATNAPYPGWTGEVATGQSFWVESTGATSLGLTESAKTGGQYQFLRESTPANYLRIALSSETQRDEALVWFAEGASDGFDDAMDARKMRNGYFDPGEEKTPHLNLSTQLADGDTDFAINAISPIACNTMINLRVRDVLAGSHKLEFSDMETISLGYQVVLVDRFTSVEKVISNGAMYEFTVTKDSASFDDNRFALRVLTPGSVYINSQTPPAISVTSPCTSETLSVTLPTQTNVSYQLFKGAVAVGEPFTGNGDIMELAIPADMVQEGKNEFDLEASVLKGCDRFMYPKALTYDFVPVQPVSVLQDGATLTSSAASGNQWLKDGELLEGATGPVLDVMESGVYSVQVSFGACSAQSENIQVQLDPLIETSIRVYPNPSSEKITVTLPETISRELKGISLHDMKGVRVVDQNTNPELLVSAEKTIDLTNVERGLYLLTINSGNRTYYLKIIRK